MHLYFKLKFIEEAIGLGLLGICVLLMLGVFGYAIIATKIDEIKKRKKHK